MTREEYLAGRHQVSKLRGLASDAIHNFQMELRLNKGEANNLSREQWRRYETFSAAARRVEARFPFIPYHLQQW